MTEASVILVRVDDANCFLWKALITGPEDTPYCGGCFIFDIYFPPSYPSVPLQCNLCTTGGGTIRFNPNLYAGACGLWCCVAEIQLCAACQSHRCTCVAEKPWA